MFFHIGRYRYISRYKTNHYFCQSQMFPVTLKWDLKISEGYFLFKHLFSLKSWTWYGTLQNRYVNLKPWIWPVKHFQVFFNSNSTQNTPLNIKYWSTPHKLKTNLHTKIKILKCGSFTKHKQNEHISLFSGGKKSQELPNNTVSLTAVSLFITLQVAGEEDKSVHRFKL